LPGLKELTLISIYRSEQLVSIVQFCERLRPILESVQGKRVVIAGDFNVDLLHHSPLAQTLLKLMRSYGFEQHVEVHTHKYGALIDHVWTNLGPSFCVSTGVLVSYWSDQVLFGVASDWLPVWILPLKLASWMVWFFIVLALLSRWMCFGRMIKEQSYKKPIASPILVSSFERPQLCCIELLSVRSTFKY
jgi:hypothetical protein